MIHAYPEHSAATEKDAGSVFDNFDDIVFRGVGHLHVEKPLELVHNFDDMLMVKFLVNE